MDKQVIRQRTADAVVILGMHRSGTSAVAGVLARLGATLPKTLMPPTKHNSRGYFESWRLMELHEQLLQSAGSDWLDWRAFNQSWLDTSCGNEFKRRAKEIFESEYASGPLPLLKDPRLCRFPDFWLQVLNELNRSPGIVIPVRSPLDVALSLQKRDGLSIAHGCLLWLRHVLEAEAQTRNLSRSIVLISEFQRDWRQACEKIADEFGISWPRLTDRVASEVDEFLSPELMHYQSTAAELAAHSDVHEWALKTFDEIGRMAGGSLSEVRFDRLDEIRRQLDDASRMFGRVLAGYEKELDGLRKERATSMAGALVERSVAPDAPEPAEPATMAAEATERRGDPSSRSEEPADIGAGSGKGSDSLQSALERAMYERDQARMECKGLEDELRIRERIASTLDDALGRYAEVRRALAEAESDKEKAAAEFSQKEAALLERIEKLNEAALLQKVQSQAADANEAESVEVGGGSGWLARWSAPRRGLPPPRRVSDRPPSQPVAPPYDLALKHEPDDRPPVMYGHFDEIIGCTASGWGWNPDRPDDPVEIEFLIDGRVVASCMTDHHRADVARDGYGTGLTGFRFTLPPEIVKFGDNISARVKGRTELLLGSPRKRASSAIIQKWLTRRERLPLRTLSRLTTRLTQGTKGQLLSIIMPVFDPNTEWLRSAIESVIDQWCGNWELICIDDASRSPDVLPLLRSYAQRDSRIVVIERQNNEGVSASVNAGLAVARGTYVGFLDHDDYLEPDAVYKMLRAARTGADLIYSDELLTGEDLNDIRSVVARPAFSYDYYISHPYFVHFICVRKALADRIGGWNDSIKSVCADVDFVLRVIEQATAIAHLPAVLYRWRTHSRSAGHADHGCVMSTTKDLIRSHFRRTGINATVSDGPAFNVFRTDFVDRRGRTLIVIPTKNRVDLLRRCIDSITTTVSDQEAAILIIDHESTDPDTVKYLESMKERHKVLRYRGEFHYPAMHNFAVDEEGDGYDFYLFMNNDVEAISSEWLTRMRSLCSRADVGAVGATLVYPDNTIQHAGVIIGVNGHADHAHRLNPLLSGSRRNAGYLSSLVSVRDYSAATGACLMVKSDVFRQMRGLDRSLKVGFNDVDLCLRMREAGHKVLIDPYALMLHRESASRKEANIIEHPEDTRMFQKIWRKLLRDGDPFYNPLLSLKNAEHQFNYSDFAGSRIGRVRVRPVVLPG